MDFTALPVGIFAFLEYFVLSAIALIVYMAIYLRLTPYHEFKEIAAGNQAAAWSLSGSMLAYALPLAMAVSQSVSLGDFLVWAGLALGVQLVVLLVVGLLLPFRKLIEAGNAGAGQFLAAAHLAGGLLNAAAMSY